MLRYSSANAAAKHPSVHAELSCGEGRRFGVDERKNPQLFHAAEINRTDALGGVPGCFLTTKPARVSQHQQHDGHGRQGDDTGTPRHTSECRGESSGPLAGIGCQGSEPSVAMG